MLVLTCARCHHYHRLLPADMRAYRDATLDQVEAALLGGPVSSSRSIPVYLYRFNLTVVSDGACQAVVP